ncbi:MAG: DUF4381 domain-containing protein [Stappiaceae bacterium]
MNEELKGLSLAELLDRLEPIPEPAPVSMLPQTGGWVILGLLLGAMLISVCIALWKYWRRNGYRRTAIDEIDAARHDPVALARILRRTALAAYPREQVASLSGRDWWQFLNANCPKPPFTEEDGTLLSKIPYQKMPDDFQLTPAVRYWVKHHQTKVESGR